MGSYSASRTQDQVSEARKVLAGIRSSNRSLRRQFLALYGEEIEKDWREIGMMYVDAHRGVYYPDDEDDALIFSIFCALTYEVYKRDEFAFPSWSEVVRLTRSCREEITRTEVVPPSYIHQSLGVYNTIWED